MKKIVPIITIIAMGAFAGNMINIGLSYGIHWLTLEPIAFMESFAIDFPLLLPPTALTLLPAWLGSLWLFIKAEKASESKKYWMYAFIGITLTIIQTSVYHLPMNLDFMAIKYDAATATSKLNGWIVMHWVRVVVAIAAGVFALLGFQKSQSSPTK